MDAANTALSRSTALLGASSVVSLANKRILIVGVGGVGSWCAEALVRTGARNLILMDDDKVVESNLNRQAEATSLTLGEPKVEAMKARLLTIAPGATITALAERFTEVSEIPAGVDYVVDAIDSVGPKATLILKATRMNLPIVSSMGAALRFDPTAVRVKRFDKVVGDGLARALRQQFKQFGERPKFNCVCSDELPLALKERGSIMPVTAAFGMALAAEVIAWARQ